jgi:Ca2+-transporting ATPase
MTRGGWWRIVWMGLVIGVVCVAAHRWGLSEGEPYARSMAFTTLTLGQLIYVLSVRAGAAPLTNGGWRANPALFATVAFTLVVQMAALYLPPLATVLGTVPLAPADMGVCFGFAALITAVAEAAKWLRRRRAHASPPAPVAV